MYAVTLSHGTYYRVPQESCNISFEVIYYRIPVWCYISFTMMYIQSVSIEPDRAIQF